MSRFARSGDETESELLDRVSVWPGNRRWSELTPADLQSITRDQGIDFATALLFDRLVRSPEHGPFIERIEKLRRHDAAVRLPANVLIAVVPGAFYLEHPGTGADGQAVCDAAQAFGCRTARIPVESIGSPVTNGSVVCDWLLENRNEQIILVSLSKGGADVQMALAHPDRERAFENVTAWFNIGGTLGGSPIVTWGLRRPLYHGLIRLLFWLRGRDFGFVRDLREQGGPLASALRIPGHIETVHIVGFPLKRHLSNPRARRWHRRLASFGPNDAVNVLARVCRFPGSVLPIWGADHYLQSGWDAKGLVSVLLRHLCDESGRDWIDSPAGTVT